MEKGKIDERRKRQNAKRESEKEEKGEQHFQHNEMRNAQFSLTVCM
jgi:hypothetical protein